MTDGNWEEPVEGSQDYGSVGNSTILEWLANGNIGGPGGLCPLDDNAQVPPTHLPPRLGGEAGDVAFSYSQLVTHTLKGSGSGWTGPGLTSFDSNWKRPNSQTTNFHINGEGTWRATNADPGTLGKYSYDTGTSLPANQYAEVKIEDLGGSSSDSYGVVLKSSVTAFTGVYVRWWASGYLQARVYSGGAWGANRTMNFPAPVGGEVFRGELNGDEVIVKVNGTVVFQTSAAEFGALSNTGRAGIVLAPGCRVSSFKAGSVTKTIPPQRGSVTTFGTDFPANPFNGDSFVHLGQGTVYMWSD